MTQINNELKIKVLELLLEKGFSRKRYEEQDLYFYTLVIDDKEFVKYKVEQVYHGFTDEDFENFNDVKLLVEIQTDFSTAQWTFIDGLDEFYIFENIEEFIIYLRDIPNKIQ